MTTFTSDDREEEYKKILAAAPFQPGYEDAVPIPFAGWVNTAPPHIVDSGASVMEMNANELANELEKGHWVSGTREQAAAMLRQLQSENEMLRKVKKPRKAREK